MSNFNRYDWSNRFIMAAWYIATSFSESLSKIKPELMAIKKSWLLAAWLSILLNVIQYFTLFL